MLHIVQVVFPLPPQASEDARRTALGQAEAARTDAKSCADMLKIGRAEAPQLSSEGDLRLNQIAPAMRSLVLGLGVEKPSEPIMQKNGVGVIMVCSKTDAASKPAVETRDDVYRDPDARASRHAGAPLHARPAAQCLCRCPGVTVVGLPLALTMGEPAGIGGEIALKAWLGREPRASRPSI